HRENSCRRFYGQGATFDIPRYHDRTWSNFEQYHLLTSASGTLSGARPATRSVGLCTPLVSPCRSRPGLTSDSTGLLRNWRGETDDGGSCGGGCCFATGVGAGRALGPSNVTLGSL